LKKSADGTAKILFVDISPVFSMPETRLSPRSHALRGKVSERSSAPISGSKSHSVIYYTGPVPEKLPAHATGQIEDPGKNPVAAAGESIFHEKHPAIPGTLEYRVPGPKSGLSDQAKP